MHIISYTKPDTLSVFMVYVWHGRFHPLMSAAAANFKVNQSINQYSNLHAFNKIGVKCNVFRNYLCIEAKCNIFENGKNNNIKETISYNTMIPDRTGGISISRSFKHATVIFTVELQPYIIYIL